MGGDGKIDVAGRGIDDTIHHQTGIGCEAHGGAGIAQDGAALFHYEISRIQTLSRVSRQGQAQIDGLALIIRQGKEMAETIDVAAAGLLGITAVELQVLLLRLQRGAAHQGDTVQIGLEPVGAEAAALKEFRRQNQLIGIGLRWRRRVRLLNTQRVGGDA